MTVERPLIAYPLQQELTGILGCRLSRAAPCVEISLYGI